MSKIVAVVASPVIGGNSDTIVSAVTDGAMGLSTNLIEFFRLDKFRALRGCSACDECKKTGRCIHNDEIQETLDAIRDSDAVIVSTPVYFNEVASQYKVLEDRMYSFYNEDFSHNIAKGKKAVVVVTCSRAMDIAKKVADRMSTTLENLGFEVTDRLLFSNEGHTKHARDDADLMARAKTAGLKFRNT